MNQSWFEMQDLKKHKLNNSVWVPLYAEKLIKNNIGYGKIGYQEEFLRHSSLMIPVEKRSVIENLDINNIEFDNPKGLNFVFGEYSQSDILKADEFQGTHLVLNQSFDNNYDIDEWHLHQDLVINLGLKREGDIWVCPRKGYVEVAKLEREQDGSPNILKIKNQYLKDYLCARGCGIYVTSYFSRNKLFNNKSILTWKEDVKSSKEEKDYWECRVLEVHEGGFPYGQNISFTHVSRIDVDEDDDIPDMTSFPDDENTITVSKEKSFKGKKLYEIIAELWKYEWINPTKTSIITLGQKENIDIFYIVDAAGNKESGNELIKGGKWLWFKPSLVNNLLSMRGSFIKWFTKDTGSISCGPSSGVHFGVNELGLISVYAKDIGKLPLWQQQIWVGHNISPEGGISKELHDSQVKANPASTKSPEAFLESIINEINIASKSQFNLPFFRGHEIVNELMNSIHRFRAVDENGLLSLAKDIARIIVDDVDVESLKKIASISKSNKIGSIKIIENLLAKKIPQEEAKKITSPFVGVYELRHGDAHLPSSDIEKSFELIRIDRSLPTIIQGYQMIYACVDNLHNILFIINNWDEIKKEK